VGPFVIARSASDEAIQTSAAVLWIASLSLAMTWKLRLHRPANIGQMHRSDHHRDNKRFHNAE
jgi:hypothetical protein